MLPLTQPTEKGHNKMSEYTHETIKYKALCLQVKPSNIQRIIEILTARGAECDTEERVSYIMVRWPGEKRSNSAYALKPGYWVVRGENGFIKFYDDLNFKGKYTPICTQ